MAEEQNVVYIYTLADPRNDVVRYIGYSKDPVRRLRGHLKDARDSRKTRWVQGLLREGIKPVMEVLERCNPGEDYQAKEVEWIAAYKNIGFELTNATDGGEGVIGYKFTEEVCNRMSLSKMGNQNLLGFHHTPETRAKMATHKSALGHKHSPSARAKNSAAHKGKHHTPEACANMSAAKIGNQNGKGNLGNKHSPETRAKIGVGLIGNKNRLGKKKEKDSGPISAK